MDGSSTAKDQTCLNCRHWPVCMKLQLDYKLRREFNELDPIFHNPDGFFKWMAERCDFYDSEQDE